MKSNAIIFQCCFILMVQCQFDVNLPVTSTSMSIQSQISLNNKEVYVNVDITDTFLDVCCKPNRDIFQIIHSFLSNPFFQINQYICPVNSTNMETSQIKLPTLGVILMTHNLRQYPECSKGTLGLSKQSIFLNYLPINDHTIKISIGLIDSAPQNKITLSLGSLNIIPDGSWTFQSIDPQYWTISGKSIQLGPLIIDSNPQIVLKSIGQLIQIPHQHYQKIISYYPSNQTCKYDNNKNKLLCLCQSGIPAYFPKISINFINDQILEIGPQNYMKIDSNICVLMFQQSSDYRWYFNVGLFSNTNFYLDRNKGQIIIQKKQLSTNQSSELISLPIPLILNCAVVLLLCVFVSLVIIEIVKRISGLSEISNQSLRQYIMRRNLI